MTGRRIREVPRRRPPSNWLDRLPDLPLSLVVQKIIFDAEPPCQAIDSAAPLHLAEVSARQREGVLSAMSYKAPPFQPFLCNPVRWAAILFYSIRCTGESYHHMRYLGRTTGYLAENRPIAFAMWNALLCSPSLRSACIPTVPAYLRAVAHAPSLRCLRVDFPSYELKKNWHFAMVLEALQALNLEELKLQTFMCRPSVDDPCLLATSPLLAPGAIPTACPNLRSLCVQCACPSLEAPVADVCRQLPMLRELTVGRSCVQQMHPDLMAVLPSIESIKIDCHLDARTIVERHSSRVTSYIAEREDEDYHDLERMNAIVRCHRLEKMQLLLGQGAEQAFQRECSFSALRVLFLSFECDSMDEFNYYEPQEGLLSRVVANAPRLTMLEITQARISRAEMQAIYKSAGNPLEYTCTCIFGQEEPHWERLCLLMENFAAHNASLKNFDLSVEEAEECGSSYAETWWRDLAEESRSVMRDRLLKSFKLLRRRCPRLRKAAPLARATGDGFLDKLT